MNTLLRSTNLDPLNISNIPVNKILRKPKNPNNKYFYVVAVLFILISLLSLVTSDSYYNSYQMSSASKPLASGAGGSISKDAGAKRDSYGDSKRDSSADLKKDTQSLETNKGGSKAGGSLGTGGMLGTGGKNFGGSLLGGSLGAGGKYQYNPLILGLLN
jgi:hypothetical protein